MKIEFTDKWTELKKDLYDVLEKHGVMDIYIDTDVEVDYVKAIGVEEVYFVHLKCKASFYPASDCFSVKG